MYFSISSLRPSFYQRAVCAYAHTCVHMCVRLCFIMQCSISPFGTSRLLPPVLQRERACVCVRERETVRQEREKDGKTKRMRQVEKKTFRGKEKIKTDGFKRIKKQKQTQTNSKELYSCFITCSCNRYGPRFVQLGSKVSSEDTTVSCDWSSHLSVIEDAELSESGGGGGSGDVTLPKGRRVLQSQWDSVSPLLPFLRLQPH